MLEKKEGIVAMSLRMSTYGMDDLENGFFEMSFESYFCVVVERFFVENVDGLHSSFEEFLTRMQTC